MLLLFLCREKELLLMPNNKVSRTPPLNDLLLIQWPLFLLSNKVRMDISAC